MKRFPEFREPLEQTNFEPKEQVLGASGVSEAQGTIQLGLGV